MKRIKLFEDFNVNEGMMSEIDIIGQNADSKEDFIDAVKAFIKEHGRGDKSVADNEEYLETLAKTYFDDEGNKLDTES